MENLFQIAIKFAPHLLILMFLAITFLQSGIDKISDWNGNLSFLKEHFSKTFLRKRVPLMLGVILVGEIIVGFLSIIGVIQIYISEVTTIGFFFKYNWCYSNIHIRGYNHWLLRIGYSCKNIVSVVIRTTYS